MRLAVAAKRSILLAGTAILVVPLFLTPLLFVNIPKAYAATDTFNSSTTWTAPAGVTSVIVEAWGGGGGGGTGTNAFGGGGGGAYSSGSVSVIAGNNYTVSVGLGGAPISNGGDSWFGSSVTLLAKGGTKGTDDTGGTGGAAASGVGTTKFSGGTGGNVSNNGRGGGGGGGSATSTANGSNGNSGSGNGGGSGGSGQGAGGDGGNNGASGTNGTAPGGGGGGGGSGGSSGSGAAGRITLTYPLISVSVSDGTVAYGILATNSSKDTTSGGLNDTQAATNDGTAAEDFNIIGQSSTNWTLAGSPGASQYSHQFCKAGSGSPDPCDASPTWTSLSTSYQQLAVNIAASSNQRFDLKINTPTSTSATSQQTVNITVQAVQH
jgi:hypothetical protein